MWDELEKGFRFFERDSDMVFALEKNAEGKQKPVIRHK